MHPDQFPPFRILAPKLARRHLLPIGNPFAHFFYFREFARTVFGEHGSRFLEALVGHLFEGDVIGGEDGGAAAAGADGVEAGVEELTLFAGGGHGVWVKGWRGLSRGGGCGFESFIFSLGAGCEAGGRV